MTEFVTAYGPKLKVRISDFGEDMAKQSMKDECDINQIMARYIKTGVLEHVRTYSPEYGYATGLDFKEAMDLVVGAQAMFSELPSAIRKRFANDPAQFLDFVSNPDNVEELRKLGLTKPGLRVAEPEAEPGKPGEGGTPAEPVDEPKT